MTAFAAILDALATVEEAERVKAAAVAEAIHTLIMGHHQSLLVSRGNIIVGILRLTDIFSAVFHKLASPPDSSN